MKFVAIENAPIKWVAENLPKDEATLSFVLCPQLDMECALLDGEQKSETTELMKEKEILDHLNRKIAELEKNIVGEKTKVKENYVCMPFLWAKWWSCLIQLKCMDYHGFGFLCHVSGDRHTRETS